jgi:hypothetical protein
MHACSWTVSSRTNVAITLAITFVGTRITDTTRHDTTRTASRTYTHIHKYTHTHIHTL